MLPWHGTLCMEMLYQLQQNLPINKQYAHASIKIKHVIVLTESEG